MRDCSLDPSWAPLLRPGQVASSRLPQGSHALSLRSDKVLVPKFEEEFLMKRPQTLAEAVEALEQLKYQRAVWSEIVEHLARFIDAEVQEADHGIVADGCVSQHVPQEVVSEFVDMINDGKIDPLNEAIDELEGLHVVSEETEEDGPESSKKKRKESREGETKSSSKGKNPKGRKGPVAIIRTGNTAKVRSPK